MKIMLVNHNQRRSFVSELMPKLNLGDLVRQKNNSQIIHINIERQLKGKMMKEPSFFHYFS